MFFEQKVDRRSRKAMVEFLASHFRYDTGNSVNRQSSYANRVKIYDLGLSSEQQDAAYAMLNSDDGIIGMIDEPIGDFTRRHNGYYTIGSNGRSGGYLVLYNSRYEDTGHKSRCLTCGQLNFKRVADLPTDPVENAIAREILRCGVAFADQVYLRQSAILALPETDDTKLAIIRRFKPMLRDGTADNRCGRCGAEGERGRVNLTQPHRVLSTSIGSIDAGEDFVDFDDWTMSKLRDRVDLVCDFDRTCDAMRDNLIDMIESCSVVEETIMVPKTVRRIACAESAA